MIGMIEEGFKEAEDGVYHAGTCSYSRHRLSSTGLESHTNVRRGDLDPVRPKTGLQGAYTHSYLFLKTMMALRAFRGSTSLIPKFGFVVNHNIEHCPYVSGTHIFKGCQFSKYRTRKAGANS